MTVCEISPSAKGGWLLSAPFLKDFEHRFSLLSQAVRFAKVRGPFETKTLHVLDAAGILVETLVVESEKIDEPEQLSADLLSS